MYVQNGLLKNIDYVVWIDSHELAKLAGNNPHKAANLIRNLNKAMENQRFILMSNDRFGTSDMGGGLPVAYCDITNAQAIVEISDSQKEKTPIRWSAHNFIKIYWKRASLQSASIWNVKAVFDQAFLETQLNQLTSWIDQPATVKAVQVLPSKDIGDLKNSISLLIKIEEKQPLISQNKRFAF